MRGVATNVYLWKTSEKPKETGQKKILSSGVVFPFEEGISTSQVCLKGQQPIF